MRTTVTLEDDLAQRLKRLAAQRGISFKAAINEAIRGGLERPPEPRPYRIKAKDMGTPKVDLTKALQLAARLEDEEIIRKLRRGK